MQRNSEMKDLNDDTLLLGEGNSSKFVIPEDLFITQCLVRLPVKSLFCYKAVSKPWRNLISSDGFAEMHLRHSKTNEKILGVGLIPERHDQVMSILKLDDGSEDAECDDGLVNVLLPLRLLPLESVVIEGSCNGLVVFRAKSNPGIVLGNPAIREFKHISLPFDEVRFSPGGFEGFPYDFCSSIGLCFISETKDFKIIAIRNVYGKKSSSSGTESYRGWVYSLNSDYWKKLDVGFPYIKNRQIGFNGMAIVFNECLHWIADEKEGRIAAFDVKNEVLEYMLFPVSKHVVRLFGRVLAIIEGSLSVIISVVDDVSHLGFEVWKMNEYGNEGSWTKVFNISKSEISIQNMAGPWKDMMPISIQVAMGSWKERKLLFKYHWSYGDLLFSYDLYTKKKKRFLMSKILNLQAINYVESMESVQGGMSRISQSGMVGAGCTPHGSNSRYSSTRVLVLSSGQDNKKEDDSTSSSTSGKEKHVINTTLESSGNNFEGETSSEGKEKLE